MSADRTPKTPEADKAKKARLIPLNQRSPEEVKRITSAGGKASAKAKKKKKMLNDLLELALSQPSNLDPELDEYAVVVLSLIEKAKLGSVKAFEVIRDTLGQKPVEKQQTDIKAKIEVDYGDDDESTI